jgi:two-component system, chemotaxis family, chemotaxis protein CheY
MTTLIHKTHILIVEDNPTDRLVTKSILRKLNFRDIQEAENGAIAISKIEVALEIGRPFELIVLDWNLPQTSGLNLLKYLKSHPRLKSTQVIVMTATSDRFTVDDALSLKPDDFIVKPVELETLQRKLEKIGFNF